MGEIYKMERSNTSELKVLFVLPHLRGGGAQRVAVNLANNLKNKVNISIFLINRDGPLLETLDKSITIYEARSGKASRAVFEIKAAIDRERYDLVFTMKDYLGLAVWLAALFSKTRPPVLYREVIHQSASLKYQGGGCLRKSLVFMLTKFMYRKVDHIVAPSEEIKEDLVLNYAVSQEKIAVIYNPVDLKRINKLVSVPVEQHWFDKRTPLVVGMGRLTAQKGFELLINAINMANKNSTVKLVMIGEGEEKENLYRLAEDLGITDMVYFAGFQDNPYRFIAGAQIFVLSSFYEGFPNSLLEAMACGTAVIAADCQSGPAEIIEHEKNGLLVPVGDKKALAEAINRLISDSALAGELSKQASEDILRYDISVIAESYLELFKKMSR